ncbi:hypothetical protein JYB62_05290 [Algoriphagus lutimaris]|uniref:hypothetical protein n=1 Tax=Algoriphagus lutimaris TaxID=613197 RepID=UPI00196A4B15|nr:hypothetical protein [Algoriphagus lutimaris]MBN3519409.1 hypothetical protein [Algoriphagus lutimaris]
MKKVLLFGAFFAFIGMSGFAQEAAEEVTNEELAKFANVEVMTSEYVDSKTEELRAMILENEIFKGGARYNEIKAAWGDEAKMAEAEVTEEEKAAYQAVQDFQNSLQDVVKEYKTELIMNDSILGASTYNKVNGAQKSDPAVKEKLEALISEMKSKNEEESEDGNKGDGK